MTCSIRELARRVGITDTAINKMRANGRLPASLFGVRDSGRPYVINPAEAERLVRQALSPASAAAAAATVAAKPEPKPAAKPVPVTAAAEPVEEPAPQPSAPPADDHAPMQVGAYQKARAMREAYQAKLAQLEFQQKSGLMVSKDEVKSGIFTAGRKLRDNLMQIPNRLAPRLAGETDQHVITMLLTEEFKSALEELARDFERNAGNS